MCKNEKKCINIKNAFIRKIGSILCLAIITLHLCSSIIGGALEDFCEAALPWLTMSVAVAIILTFSNKDVTEKNEK